MGEINHGIDRNVWQRICSWYNGRNLTVLYFPRKNQIINQEVWGLERALSSEEHLMPPPPQRPQFGSQRPWEVVRWLTPACNSRSKASDSLFWPLWAPTLTFTHTYTHTHTHTHTQIEIYESETFRTYSMTLISLKWINYWWKCSKLFPMKMSGFNVPRVGAVYIYVCVLFIF
jgi:hypothetical protein